MKNNILLWYELEGIGSNIKCAVKICDKVIFRFNCQSKYEDSAEETIQEVFKEWLINGGSLKSVCERKDIPIEKLK